MKRLMYSDVAELHKSRSSFAHIITLKSKRLMKIIITLLMLISCVDLMAQDLTVMTYNIRYDNPKDGDNRWDNRKKFLVDQIKFYQPHAFGVQEGMAHQIDFIDHALPNYSYIGVGRDDGKTKGEYSAVFYKNDQLDTLKQGTFWLSENPDEPSVGWDASMERICTYALFTYEKTSFWVFNTHFDHKGDQARVESAKLILKKINKLNTNNLPVIFMGDLNSKPTSKPIQFITQSLSDSKLSTAQFYGMESTFNGFNNVYEKDKRIDYIFHSKNIKVLKSATLSQTYEQRFLSDHFPVIAHIRFEDRE